MRPRLLCEGSPLPPPGFEQQQSASSRPHPCLWPHNATIKKLIDSRRTINSFWLCKRAHNSTNQPEAHRATRRRNRGCFLCPHSEEECDGDGDTISCSKKPGARLGSAPRRWGALGYLLERHLRANLGPCLQAIELLVSHWCGNGGVCQSLMRDS